MPVGRDGGGHGGRKNRVTITALSPVQGARPNSGASADQVNKQSTPLEKKPVKSGKYDINHVLLYNCEFREIILNSRSSSEQCARNRF